MSFSSLGAQAHTAASAPAFGAFTPRLSSDADQIVFPVRASARVKLFDGKEAATTTSSQAASGEPPAQSVVETVEPSVHVTFPASNVKVAQRRS